MSRCYNTFHRWQWKCDVPKFSFQTIQKRNRLKILSYRRYGENGKEKERFLGLFVHAAVRGGTCAFTLKIDNTLIDNSSRDGRPSISAWNQSTDNPVRRWRPRRYQVDPWSTGREVARGVLCSSPKPDKRSIFRHRRGIEKCCRLFSTKQRPNVFVSGAWPAPATYHQSLSAHCDQRVGRSP